MFDHWFMLQHVHNCFWFSFVHICDRLIAYMFLSNINEIPMISGCVLHATRAYMPCSLVLKILDSLLVFFWHRVYNILLWSGKGRWKLPTIVCADYHCLTVIVVEKIGSCMKCIVHIWKILEEIKFMCYFRILVNAIITCCVWTNEMAAVFCDCIVRSAVS